MKGRIGLAGGIVEKDHIIGQVDVINAIKEAGWAKHFTDNCELSSLSEEAGMWHPRCGKSQVN